MSPQTIFDKIISREVPANIVYEDELCLAFQDIEPQAPIHILVIPKKAVASLQAVESDDEPLLGHLLLVTRQIAAEQGIGDSGYRCIVNTGPHGGQEVQHLHIHLLGGCQLGSLVEQGRIPEAG